MTWLPQKGGCRNPVSMVLSIAPFFRRSWISNANALSFSEPGEYIPKTRGFSDKGGRVERGILYPSLRTARTHSSAPMSIHPSWCKARQPATLSTGTDWFTCGKTWTKSYRRKKKRLGKAWSSDVALPSAVEKWPGNVKTRKIAAGMYHRTRLWNHVPPKVYQRLGVA